MLLQYIPARLLQILTNTLYRSAERYDPREGFWVRLPCMSTRRGCHALTVLGDVLSVTFSSTSDLFMK
jgi:hypothetical protein